MTMLEYKVPQQLLENIRTELGTFDHGAREFRMLDSPEFIDVNIFTDNLKNNIWEASIIHAQIMVKRYIDDDDHSLLIFIQTYETVRHVLDITIMQKYDAKCLVRCNDMAQFIHDLLVDKKINSELMYKNVKKIRGSSYGSQLYDVDIIHCDQ